MEHKLMKVIKEVNESDLSETNTPVNSPGIFQVSFLLSRFTKKMRIFHLYLLIEIYNSFLQQPLNKSEKQHATEEATSGEQDNEQFKFQSESKDKDSIIIKPPTEVNKLQETGDDDDEENEILSPDADAGM